MYAVGHDDGAHHAGAQVALLARCDEILRHRGRPGSICEGDVGGGASFLCPVSLEQTFDEAESCMWI